MRLVVIQGNFPALILVYKITDSADIGSKGAARVNNSSAGGVASSSRTLSNSEMPKQGKTPIIHGK